MEKTYKLSETEYKKLIDTFIEVKLTHPDNFLKVAETLTRIGVQGNKGGQQTLYQSCHILHKNNPDRYFIVHFKEMFLLDGKEADFTEADRLRRNRIVKLLQDFGLVEVVKPFKRGDLTSKMIPITIRVLKHSEKKEWKLEQKYTVGNKHRATQKEAA